jgi:hypothetical protein
MKSLALFFLLCGTVASFAPVSFNGNVSLNGQVSIGQPPGDVVTSGLLAWWRFDEGSGTSVADSSGNGKTGTLVNGTAWTTSNGSHGAVQFDGTDDLMSFSVPTGGTSYSVAMWIYPIASSADYGVLCAEISGNVGFYYRGGDRKIYFHPEAAESTTLISENAWHHVAVVVTAGARVLYLDGSSDSASAGSLGALTLTHMGSNEGGNLFKGKVSNARIYGRALSGAEVTTLFNNP